MPTSLERFAYGSTTSDEHLDHDAQGLLHFYAAATVTVLLLLTLEAYLGMYAGLSRAEAIVHATGLDLIPNEFLGVW